MTLTVGNWLTIIALTVTIGGSAAGFWLNVKMQTRDIADQNIALTDMRSELNEFEIETEDEFELLVSKTVAELTKASGQANVIHNDIDDKLFVLDRDLFTAENDIAALNAAISSVSDDITNLRTDQEEQLDMSKQILGILVNNNE